MLHSKDFENRDLKCSVVRISEESMHENGRKEIRIKGHEDSCDCIVDLN